MKQVVEPILIRSQLAGTPKREPTYSKKVQLKTGESLSLADPKATRAMIALMDMQAVMGGAASHFGGPAAFAELMSACHAYMFHVAEKAGKNWHELFHFINDAGHCENGIYALKANYGFADLNLQSLKGFRSIESRLTGHGESHIFPEAVYLSNGPLGSSIPQSQGLAMAEVLSGKNRITVAAISDGACMEGEAKEAFAAIPGLAQKGELGPYILILSDNNTKLSGRIDSQSFSMAPSFAAFEALGWEVLHLEDGHDLSACLLTFEVAVEKVKEAPQKPILIHAQTIKGYGVKAMESSSSGGHGFPLKTPKDLSGFIGEIYGEDPLPQEFKGWIQELQDLQAEKSASVSELVDVPSEKVQLGVAQALIKKRREGLPIISVTSDLPGSTGVEGFRKEFPECSIDVGIAEANMLSVAAGLSKEGYIPIVDTFAQFGVTKGALPFTMAALSEAPIIAIFSHAGFQDAADGASHQALSYFAMTHAIPQTDVYCLTASEEAEQLISQSIDRFAEARKNGEVPRTQIFFLGRENFPRRFLAEDYKYSLGQAQIIKNNAAEFSSSVTISAAGPMLVQALAAAEKLSSEGIGSIVVNPSIINHPDIETFSSCLKITNGYFMTVEDHQLIGGMGAVLVHSLMNSGVQPLKLRSLGVEDQFGQSAYQALDLYQKHSIDSKSIVKAVKKLLD